MSWAHHITILFLAGNACLSLGTECSNKQNPTMDDEEPEESALLQVSKVKAHSKDDTNHITISGGVEERLLGGTPKFLSSTESGDNVDLWVEDTGTGRQKWIIKQVPHEDYYTIQISGGIEDNVFGEYRTYLSSTITASNVDLHTHDDGSGRQHWLITKTSGGYHIRVGKGAYDVFDNYYSYLSATESGGVDIHTKDDGSGRQVWNIDGGWVLPPVVPPPPVDPYAGWCKGAIRGGNACCDPKCTQCGGKGCGKLYKKSASDCCVGSIIASTPQCKTDTDTRCHFHYE